MDLRFALLTRNLLGAIYGVAGIKVEPPSLDDLMPDFSPLDEPEDEDFEEEPSAEDIEHDVDALRAWVAGKRRPS